ncbi:hypothetical protein [Sulfobacillus harzensis]|uniref:DUF5666 domain-containing protein n=1 Tax=Sulfobacillus harzensis TaxID=2729629 RepID=A0A7Y0L2G3_9FIRM|nr:hypothetical protein [Sulfobacillus harzensis]NMP22073.1 hypothetical protein [Sulfobacillus harzensis]
MLKTLAPIAAAAIAGGVLVSSATFADSHHRDAKPANHPYVVHGVYASGSVGTILGNSSISVKTPNGNVTVYITAKTDLHLEANGTAGAMLSAINSHHLYITARVVKSHGKLTALSLNAKVNAQPKEKKHPEHYQSPKKHDSKHEVTKPTVKHGH